MEDTMHHWRLLEHWDIGPVAEIAAMGWTGDAWGVTTTEGRRFVLKRNPDFGDIAAAARVLAHLAAQGLPVPVLLPTREGALWASDGAARVVLSPHLPGEEATDHYGPGAEARAAAFGEGIARLHDGLAACDGLVASRELGLTAELRGPIQEALRARAAPLWRRLAAAHAELVAEMAVLEPRLPAQLIHGDAHPGNLLLDGGRVSGYLDFDMVVRGARFYDLAYCSTAMLAGDFGHEARRERWPTLVRELVRGYERTSPLTAAERRALCPVQLMIQLDFAAFHTRRGRPESAAASGAAALWIRSRRQRIEECTQ